MRKCNYSIEPTMAFIQEKRNRFLEETGIDKTEKEDPKRELKLISLTEFVENEIFLKITQINQSGLQLNSRDLFEKMAVLLNENSQYIYLLIEIFQIPIKENKLISSEIKKLSFHLLNFQHNFHFKSNDTPAQTVSETINKQTCALDFLPYLDVLVNNMYHLKGLNQILIDFSSDENFSIHLNRACFRQRLILNNFSKIEENIKSICKMRLGTINIINKNTFVTSIHNDLFWNRFSVSRIFLEVLRDINYPFKLENFIENKFSTVTEHLDGQHSFVCIPQISNCISIDSSMIKSNYLIIFFQRLYQIFSFFQPSNILIYLIKKKNLIFLLNIMKMCDLVKYSISYWDHGISISNRQSIIINWFKFHKFFFSFNKNILLTYITYKKWIKYDIKDIFNLLPKYILEISQKESRDEISQITLDEGDYEHPDLLQHFFIQFLGMITVYEFNKKEELKNKNLKILSANDIFQFYQQFIIFKYQEESINLMKVMNLKVMFEKILSATQWFSDQYNDHLKFPGKKKYPKLFDIN